MIATPQEAIRAYRRVLKLVNRYLYRQQQDCLITDGRGLMTWGEIRHHIKSALAIRISTRKETGR